MDILLNTPMMTRSKNWIVTLVRTVVQKALSFQKLQTCSFLVRKESGSECEDEPEEIPGSIRKPTDEEFHARTCTKA
jgi:hypothetical protein